MSIEITNETSIDVDEAALLRMASFALDAMRIHPDADLSIVLKDVGPMEELHVQFLDEPGPTDVLSFPMDQLRPGTDDRVTPPGLLGDVAICPEVAAAQASEAGHSTEHEINVLLTHGILHLLGFDHADPDEELQMFGIQRDIVRGFELAEKARDV